MGQGDGKLFESLELAGDRQYREYLNWYDIIYLDMTEVIGEASVADVVPYIQRNIIRELAEQYPQVKLAEGFAATLANAAIEAGKQFIIIIDEWDAPIREAKGQWDLRKRRSEGCVRPTAAILRG